MRLICDVLYNAVLEFDGHEINVVILGGVVIQEQLYRNLDDLNTEYRARWHDECIRGYIDKINNKDITTGICPNKTMDKVIINGLEKDIWFLDIRQSKIARWDIHRPHDKIHVRIQDVTRYMYQSALMVKAITDEP